MSYDFLVDTYNSYDDTYNIIHCLDKDDNEVIVTYHRIVFDVPDSGLDIFFIINCPEINLYDFFYHDFTQNGFDHILAENDLRIESIRTYPAITVKQKNLYENKLDDLQQQLQDLNDSALNYQESIDNFQSLSLNEDSLPATDYTPFLSCLCALVGIILCINILKRWYK